MPSRRGQISLTEEEQTKFIEDGWTLQVASIGPKGYPHLVAMWYVVIDGLIHFTTFGKSQKILNLKRDGKITCMLEAGKGYNELKGVVIEGQGEVLEDPPFTARVMGLVGQKYSGSPIPDQPSEATMKVATKRVVVRVKPEDVYSWDHAKLGGRY